MVNVYIAWGIHSDTLKVQYVRLLIKNIVEIKVLKFCYPCILSQLSTEVSMLTN